MRINPFFKTLSAAALAIVLAACGGQKDSAPARYNRRRLRRYGKRPNPTGFGEKRL